MSNEANLVRVQASWSVGVTRIWLSISNIS